MTIAATPPPGSKPVVGMIHLPPLPGAPNADDRSVAQITAIACEDARRLEAGGVDAILLQNANDHPPRKTISPATVACYAVVAAAVRRVIGISLGISVLKSDPAASLGIAIASDAGFVRLKSYVGVEVGAEGIAEGCAAEAVRLRRELGMVGRIEIWADAIQPTSRQLGGIRLAELVGWCVEFGLADRVILTGASFAESLAMLDEVRGQVSVPLILGGGVDPSTARRALAASDGVIVGRYLRGHSLARAVDIARTREFMAAARDDSVTPRPTR